MDGIGNRRLLLISDQRSSKGMELGPDRGTADHKQGHRRSSPGMYIQLTAHTDMQTQRKTVSTGSPILFVRHDSSIMLLGDNLSSCQQI
ncbi:hypothetical protein ACJX0J_017248, partial [Zea mays]